MAESAEAVELPTTRSKSVEFHWLTLESCVLCLLIACLYVVIGWKDSILARLVMQWWNDPNFSHGFFVPVFSLFVLWQSRSRLRTIPISPTWIGLPVVILALLMLLLGVLGVELFTARSSLLVLLAGLILLFRGWPQFRAVLFPWAFLFMMIPLPAIIMSEITFPLQIFASKLATDCLQIIDIPALREGNQIHLAHITLQVVDACSGIRSLVSLITLAIIYGYLLENRNRVRVVLACAAIPIAIVANIFRIFVTGVLAERWSPEKAMGFYHEFEGWLVFVVSLILLFSLHRIIDLIWKPAPARLQARRSTESSPREFEPPTVPAHSGLASARFVIAALLMLSTAAVLKAKALDEVVPPRQPLSSLPQQFGNWTGVDLPIDDETRKTLGDGELLWRDYEDATQAVPGIDIFISYYPTQKFGDTFHTPRNCLIGAGFTPIRREIVQLSGPNGTFPANRWVAVKGLERELAIYWFQAHGREVASEYSAKYHLIDDSIHLHRSDGSLIRLMTPMYPNESPDAAQARIMALGSQILPLLDQYIPR